MPAPGGDDATTVQPGSPQPTILIVEDEFLVARDLRETLEDLGYAVVATVATGEDAVRVAHAQRPTVILMDIRLAGELDGIQAAARIRSDHDIPVVFLTSHSSDETLRRATQAEPFGYLVKPFRPAELRCAIEVAIQKHRAVTRLQSRERWLETTLQSIGDGVVTTDADQRINYLNPVAEALTGWRREDALGRTLDEVLTVVGERGGRRGAAPGEPGVGDAAQDDDAVLVARDGSEIPIADSAAPIVGKDGGVVGGVIVFRDVSDRRSAEEEIRQRNADLERRVVERTAELEDAIEELRAFNDSVAHDLRAPLRGIEGFSQILVEDHAAELDPDARAHLAAVQRSVRHMQHLLDDLLRLSRAAGAELSRGPVDLSGLARDAVARLRAADRERAVTVEIADAITVTGDARLLAIAMDNLIGNAWKFTSKRPRATIEVGARDQGGGRVCFVRDDGAGFDASRATRLFGAFQRYHPASEFDGTGLGLAIVQRIIQRHNGRIWVDSAVGAGATFSFVL